MMKKDTPALPHAAPKAIHEFRTQARRIGIVAKLCRDPNSRLKSHIKSDDLSATELKEIEIKRRAYGPVREIDVLLDLIDSHHAEWFSPTADADRHQLTSWLRQVRSQAERSITESWDPNEELPKAQKVAISATNHLQGLNDDEKHRVLSSLHHLLTESAKLSHAKYLTSKQLHRVRRRIRDCRYAIETLSTVGWIQIDLRMIKKLRKMQAMLGAFTDIEASKNVVKKLQSVPQNAVIKRCLKKLSRNLKQEKQSQMCQLREVIPDWSGKLKKLSRAFPS